LLLLFFSSSCLELLLLILVGCKLLVQIEMEFKMLHSFLELLTHLHFYTLISLSMINGTD
jgi:hypothetical protein